MDSEYYNIVYISADYLDYVVNYSMLRLFHPERGVTANIPVLGTGDSGFESRRSDMDG